MVKVDTKGRIVLPQQIRERLGIAPGTEVRVREVDGKAVVEPEDDPERIIDRMEHLVSEVAADRDAPTENMHPIAEHHAEAIRRGRVTGDE